MGVGKTTVGTALAARLGLPFVDLDDLLVARHGPIADQLRDPETFRQREADAVRSLDDGAAHVLATGGGAWLDPESRSALRSQGEVVWLDLPFNTIAARRPAGRPLWDARVQERFVARRPVYALADVRWVPSGDPRATADDLAAALRRDRVRVQVGVGYDAVAAPGFAGLQGALRRAGVGTRSVVVTDDRVGPLWAGRVEASLPGHALDWVTIPAGAQHKTLDTWRTVVDSLLALRVDRNTSVLALGGGVVGDLAGFAASACLRGLPVVQLPTTLLAMVDASIGGKVGVDHRRGRNLVGAFHQPALVWAALDTLETLPPAERRAGFGEVVKTALLADAVLLARLEAGPVPVRDVVARCVAAKASLVSRDAHERGDRALLNAGHTVGHALESAVGPGALRHGEAVGLGLVREARWAVTHGVCTDPALPDRIAGVLGSLGLPTVLPEVDLERFHAALAVDKKGQGDRLRIPLPTRAGDYAIHSIPRAQLATLLEP